MTDVPQTEDEAPLTRTAASEAVTSIGWRYLLHQLSASVPVPSLHQAADAAVAAAQAAGKEADGHLRIDLRRKRVELSVQTYHRGVVTGKDVELAYSITAALADLGLQVAPPISSEYLRPVASLELAIDALDIGAVRPFWKVVLGYVDDPSDPGPSGALVDPAGQGPTVWFQQMDQPRPQRNRVHVDVTVAHDEAWPRVEQALAAGGQMVNDAYARMFWVLADVEGNECCICTWTDRDEWVQSHQLG